MSKQELLDRLEAHELAKFARISTNIDRAFEDGRISEHDRNERIARAGHQTALTIAHFTGKPRPAPRQLQALDDPDAGKVG